MSPLEAFEINFNDYFREILQASNAHDGTRKCVRACFVDRAGSGRDGGEVFLLMYGK